MAPRPRTHWLLAVALVGTAACTGSSGAPAAGTSGVHFPAGWPFAYDQPPAVGQHAMLTTTDSLATAAGLEILRAGGNAVDAAIAVQFALAVVHPQAGNLGGGGFLVVRLANDTRAALDFRERAPAAGSPDMYLDAEGHLTPASWTGHLAAGVPGSVAGMAEAHRRFGSLPWKTLLQPALGYAREGIRVNEGLRSSLAAARDRLARFPQTAAIFLPGGSVPAVGSLLRQLDLARTLDAIATEGEDVFYRGWIADSLAAEMKRGGGLITRRDLADYRAVWREPVVFRYRDREIISMPPPSSGGVTLAEILNILEGFDPADADWHSARTIHRMVEAMRRAYADRNYWLGDPDYVEIPLERLLSQSYADSLRETIEPDRASPSVSFGGAAQESPQTTHFSVVDEEGTAVAVTTTLNGSFGSAVVARGTGFLLNNEMDDFTAKPGVANAYGLVQGEANAIQAGKRMLSSMAPTIVVAPEGRTELVTGTPGGATIITTVAQVLINLVDYGLPVQASVNAPRFHHQNLPDRIFYERGGLAPDVVASLRGLGHELEERKGFSGDAQTIYIAPDGTRYGAADPRGGGRAAGY